MLLKIINDRDSKDAGESTCPACKRHWIVTVFDDCMMPICGCFGHDVSANNPNRVCNGCGIQHAMKCKRMPKPRRH